ncbi:nascent polypeptide-associated complex subunit alpha, muscle-specific form isoform X1 [Xiphophorus hellerii]|uniref:nascent polypeptide-associated complex subunit alpha, muscle-specific form isoform X1 n=2 Tax=Xiphophorus hellerii TaxID=8084 RepID=UPI0013B4552F|nr:nascent polypeptide-associated complex subunit alpha, muscle-specific form-like isoform X1 [Xiphophorus hellerii]XP_032401950.1 nascent polypeptide-associated complex subunit alpha, muscle-specific form-like isoform X1 [Xiphophorus hellerii]
MPEGARRGSQRSPSNSAAKRPSSVSSLSGIVGRMMSAGERGASSSSCTSVNTVCSDGERPVSLSLSSSTSSVSLQDASSSSSSSSSSLPYGAVPAYNASSSTPKRNGSDISLDLTPLVTPPTGAPLPVGGGVSKMAVTGHAHNGHTANPVAVLPAGAAPRQLSRLDRVILEIVETEQTYVRDLKSIVEDYLGCIIDCGALPLKPEQVSSLFCNIEDIYEFNSDLLEDLERSPDAAAIAECFVERSEAFDIYTLYCMNYPNSVAVLRDCMKNGSLVRFFQERQATLNHSLPLETYLLKPVQRILKYHLLLQELSKHVDKSDPGYEVVEDAIVTMTAVAWYINDMKRKQEHAVRLQEIESLLLNWSGPDLSGFGDLVLEGSFKVQRVKKERAFFLFDKMLLIAKKRLEQFVYSTHIFCCNLQLVETLKDPLSFRVSDQTIPKQQHVVQTKNQEEKRLWVHYLKRLIVENHPASLPQKARQVLGDNFCQSPQFDQESLKKSCASPRLDDLQGFHRGRRQSEPPELLLYTPEKSRKGLPLLLEGTLPYRRTRRQSAPAKDIEAAFRPGAALKQAGSEGELCPAESLGSADSSSTLASSVIEVETERRERRELEEEEDEEEELAGLRAPPTLSITEEILEFINQSRVMEGLSATNQNQDPPGEVRSPADPAGPLPAVASGPEQRLLVEPDQEGEDLKKSIADRDPAGEGPDGSGETAGIKGEEAAETGPGSDDEDEQTPEKPSSSDLQPSISAEENTDRLMETEPHSPGPVSQPIQPGTIQRYQAPKKGSTLTNQDKKIIEKIRSYYEAAEAEEDEAEDEEEQREGAATRRRSSFSQIPSGLVKESVSRFTVQPTLDDAEATQESRSGSSSLPADVEEPLRSPEGEPESPDQPSLPRQNPDSEPRTFPEPEVQEEFYRGSPEEPEEGKSVAVKTTEEESLALSEHPDKTDKERTIEPQPSQAEPSIHGPAQEPGQTTNQARTQSTWSRTKTTDPTNLRENLERFPSQSKVGRWSRHSKIVSANRALFEGMGSDVTGIGLFETNPVVDPVLMENSERILSKVQTLARMYSAKANTIKVPLLHKRVSTIRTQAWVSARLSELSAQNRDRSPPEQEKETEAQTGSETKTETQACNGPIQNQTQTMIQEGRPEPWTDDLQQEEAWPSVTRTRDVTCSTTPGEGPCDQNQAVSSRTEPQPRGSSRDSSAEEEEEDEAAAVSPEPEEPQEAGGGPEQDEGHRVDAAGGRRTSGNVSAPPAVAEGNGPDRDSAAGHHEADEGGRPGLIPTPTESRTTGEPGLSQEPSPKETQREDGSGPAGSTGWPDTVDPTDHKIAAGPQKDETPSSPCSADSLLAGVHRASAVPWERRKPDEPLSGSSLRTTSPVPSVFNASLIHRSPSPLRSASASSVQAPPCSSPFRLIPVSSPTPASPAVFTSALSCLSPTASTVSSVRSPTPSLPLCGNSSSSRGTPSSPTPPLHSPTCSSSAFTRSLAASHISQSISQSMSKKGTARQQAPTIKLMNPSPSSTPDLRRRTRSPNPPTAQLGPALAYTQLGCTKEGYQHPRCPPSSVRSSCLSPPSVSQCPPSPTAGLRQPRCSSPSPRPSFLHSKSASPQLGKKNSNNNNSARYVGGAVSNGGCLGADGRTEPLQSQYPLWSGSHNRVARPFSASEPSSRVQSPTPSPTPASFVRLCSPPQHNYSSPMANKPPHPRSSRVGGSHNHLDLRLDLPRASFDGSSCGDSSACVSPRILSPPPIGVPVWTNYVAAPQPRNPRHSASPSLFSSTSGSQTYRIPSSPLPSQIVRRPLSSTLSDRPPSPARSTQRRSWADFGQRSLGFTESSRRSFEQQESCPISPNSGWSSHSSSPSCLSPRAGLQCPLSPTRLASGKGAISGQHFTSVPWPDVRELSSKYNGEDSPETSVSPSGPISPVHLIPSPCPTDGQADWGDPQLEEGSCRTQLICAYVTRPSHQQTVSSSSCLIFSPSGLTSPPPESHQLHSLQVQRQPQVTASPPPPSTLSPSPIISSPLPKQGSQKASYATTVNLQIAGSGRITSYSSAQVSLTQTLQGGAGPPGSQDQMARRVSINGLSPVPQGCNRP